MRKILSLRRSFLALLLLALTGCGQRLNYERTVELSSGDVQLILIDPPKREQQVSVMVSPVGSPIDVYVVLDKDSEAGKQALLDHKKPAGSLASKTKTQEATLEATIPANSGFAILLGGASKSTRVTVNVTGR